MNAKYRAWTVETNEEVKGNLIQCGGKCYIPQFVPPYPLKNEKLRFLSGEVLVEVQPKSIGQFTGLKDKNVWEDDILESEDGLRRFVVTYSDKSARWYLKGIGKAWCVHDTSWGHYKKVGNIHENPSLLEK